MEVSTGAICVVVADDGPGIPSEQRDGAFERFVRLGTAEGSEESGLGLAIVRSAADRLGGFVAFGAAAQGTTIVLRFTLRAK